MEMRQARAYVILNDEQLKGTPWDELQPSILREVAYNSLEHVLNHQGHEGLCSRFNNLRSGGGQDAKQEKQTLHHWTVSWFVKKWTSKRIDKKQLTTHSPKKQQASPCSCSDKRVCLRCQPASFLLDLTDSRESHFRIDPKSNSLLPAKRMKQRTAVQREIAFPTENMCPLTPCINVHPARSIGPLSYQGLRRLRQVDQFIYLRPMP